MNLPAQAQSMVLGEREKAQLRERALELGFAKVGVAMATEAESHGFFLEWLEKGFHGSMDYLKRHAAARLHPSSLLTSVRSVWMLAHTLPHADADASIPKGHGRIARYAWGGDYHRELKSKLGQLAEFCRTLWPQMRTRGVVDTAPLLERDFARRAGLGWIGKNCMLIDKNLGSHLLLAGFLTSAHFPVDPPHSSQHCGTCTACLTACPTGALVAPGQLDARACISYFTIETRGPFPATPEMRRAMGDWLFGCDLCQDACPWNAKAERQAPKSPGVNTPSSGSLVSLDPWWVVAEPPEKLDDLISQKALERTGWVGLKRNALWVLANQIEEISSHGISAEMIPWETIQIWEQRKKQVKEFCRHPDPGISEAATFLLGKIDSLGKLGESEKGQGFS